jgi:hypothetical protein
MHQGSSGTPPPVAPEVGTADERMMTYSAIPTDRWACTWSSTSMSAFRLVSDYDQALELMIGRLLGGQESESDAVIRAGIVCLWKR